MKTEIKSISGPLSDIFNAILEREMKAGWTPIPESFCMSEYNGAVLMKREVDTAPKTIQELKTREGAW